MFNNKLEILKEKDLNSKIFWKKLEKCNRFFLPVITFKCPLYQVTFGVGFPLAVQFKWTRSPIGAFATWTCKWICGGSEIQNICFT